MTRLLLFLFMYSVTVGFACRPVNLKNCSYQECLMKLKSYPQEVLVLVPESSESVRIHFHGFILGLYPEYETTLPGMIQAFNLESRICQSKEVVIVPRSLGKCETFEETFTSSESVRSLLSELNLTGLPLHLSAHSGGGKTLARLLRTDLQVNRISLFDALYGQTEKNNVARWYRQVQGKMRLVSVKETSPNRWMNELIRDLGARVQTSEQSQRGISYEVQLGSRLIHLSRPAGPEGSLRAHYQVLRETWE